MSYKTICTVVTDQQTDGPTLKAAAGLARQNGAHLDVTCIGIDPVRYEVMPSASLMMVDISASEADARAKELADWANATLEGEVDQLSINAVALPQLGIESVIARMARYADVIVVGRPYGPNSTPMQATVLESALFGTSAPVLVVPETGVSLDKHFTRALIAWNETDEALNAIRAAMPMLRAAHRADIVMIDPPSHSPERSDPGGAVCMMLSRQGIRAEVSILAKTMPNVSDILQRFARENGCDVIVMGGYGHSRFREAVFGGATRDMLAQSPLPLLMAH